VKSPTEKQQRARRGHSCTLSDGKLGRSCGNAEVVSVEFRLCPVHEKRLRKIVEDSKKAHRRERWAA
jgi:hypothetical protein